MRPQQQNRRMRGRNNNNNNNNRKGPNPLTRNYESNGPDVKIRGSAQQIAEKYAHAGSRRPQLRRPRHGRELSAACRTLQSHHRGRSGADADPAHARPARRSRRRERGRYRRRRERRRPGAPQQSPVNHGSGPQPIIEGTPAEVALNQEGLGQNGGERRDRPANGGYGGNPDGGDEAHRRSRRPRRGRGRSEQGGLAGAPEGQDGDDAADATEPWRKATRPRRTATRSWRTSTTRRFLGLQCKAAGLRPRRFFVRTIHLESLFACSHILGPGASARTSGPVTASRSGAAKRAGEGRRHL